MNRMAILAGAALLAGEVEGVGGFQQEHITCGATTSSFDKLRMRSTGPTRETPAERDLSP